MSGPEPSAGRKPKHHDFIETHEGLLFCVLGYLHPPDRCTAYLQYDLARPDSGGGRARYEKVLHRFSAPAIAETIRYLEDAYPHYVYDCPVQGLRLPMVPHGHIRRYLLPEVRLKEVLHHPRDPLEELIRDLALNLAVMADIPDRCLGITGSVLPGVHDPESSDIDLVVLGREHTLKIRAALARAALAGRGSIAQVEGWRKQAWADERIRDFRLTAAEAQYLVQRLWNHGLYRGRFFSITPVRADAEITETYLSRTYRDTGDVEICATIADAGEAIFLPAAYGIDRVTVLRGPDVPITELVSYDVRFVDAFDAGTTIEASGKLEKVQWAGGQTYRLLVGSARLSGRDYIRPARSTGGH